MSDPRSNLSLSNPWHLLATGFGSGLSPIVPGTMGTLASVPFYLMLAQLPWILYAVVVVFASLIGIKFAKSPQMICRYTITVRLFGMNLPAFGSLC